MSFMSLILYDNDGDDDDDDDDDNHDSRSYTWWSFADGISYAGFGLSKHVIRDTPPRIVFVSVRFLLRSIQVFSSQRSFVISTWSF